MEPLRMLRYAIQVAALAIFIWQIVAAVERYLSKQTLFVHEETTLDKTIHPTMLVCAKAQYDYPGGKEIGYKRPEWYAAGNPKINYMTLMNSFTWNGLNSKMTDARMTKQEVIQKLFIAKYGKEEIIINFGNQSTATDTVTLVNRFMLPLGQCKEIQFGSDVDKANGFKFELVNIKSNKQNFRLIFTDSLQTQKFTVAHSSMTGDQITDTVDLRKLYQVDVFETVYKPLADDCAEYGEDHEYLTYADCVAQDLIKLFVPLLGCMPPWLNFDNECVGKVGNSSDKLSLLSKLEEFWLKFLWLEDFEAEGCPKPCRRTFFKSRLLASEPYSLGNPSATRNKANIQINFGKTVQMKKSIIAYNHFDLLVEVGSCIGLWFGLSVLGIFDLIIPVTKFLKNICRCRKKAEVSAEPKVSIT